MKNEAKNERGVDMRYTLLMKLGKYLAPLLLFLYIFVRQSAAWIQNILNNKTRRPTQGAV